MLLKHLRLGNLRAVGIFLALMPGDLDDLGATVPGLVQWEGEDSLCEAE